MKRIDHDKIDKLKKELQTKIDELTQDYDRKIKEVEKNCFHEAESRYTDFISYYAYGYDYRDEFLIGVCKYCKESYQIRFVKTHVLRGR